MKLLIDMPVSPSLARWLEREGHNAVHVAYIGLSRSSDEEIMAYARREGRIIVTADLNYPRLLALTGSSDPGLILFRGGSYQEGEMLELMKRVLAAISPEEFPNSVVVVNRRAIRRRRLPFEL